MTFSRTSPRRDRRRTGRSPQQGGSRCASLRRTLGWPDGTSRRPDGIATVRSCSGSSSRGRRSSAGWCQCHGAGRAQLSASSSAQADDPVAPESLAVTGCPACAGHDDRPFGHDDRPLLTQRPSRKALRPALASAGRSDVSPPRPSPAWRGREAQFASGSGRTWMCTARGRLPMPFSASHGVRSPLVLHRPRPFQPPFGSSMRASSPLA